MSGIMVPTLRKNLLPLSHPSVKVIFIVMNLWVTQKVGILGRLKASNQAINNLYCHHF
jgi:hypothetical protein